MYEQGELFPLDVEIDPTDAMKAGKTAVYQCSWCGLLVCSSRRVRLGRCPARHEQDNNWWPQDLPVGPFRTS